MATSGQRKSTKRHDPTALGRMFKRRLKAGDFLAAGMVLEYLHPSLAKIYRHVGFDFIFVDKEHVFLDGSEITDFVLCARDNKIPVISKIGELNRSEVARLLESGMIGIQLPRTETREQLLELAEYVKFPPLGSRAGAPCFGNVDYLWPADSKAWLRNANASTVIVAHIETALAYENAEEIMTTPHVDMVYVGPYDFSIAMGQPGEYDHPNVRKPMLKILKLCRKHQVPFGTTPSGPEAAQDWIRRGCQFFLLVDELTLIHKGASEALNACR